jgi:predicted flap endonuclease-1-like 5' DNA nuclease
MGRYKLNPNWPSYPCATINGVNFDADTVVEGEQWKKFAKPMFPGKSPQLTQVSEKEKAMVTKPEPNTPAARQEKRSEPKATKIGPSEALTIAAMNIEKESGVIPEPAAAQEHDFDDDKETDPAVTIIMPENKKRESRAEDEQAKSELELTDIKGVGGGRAEKLAESGFKTVKDVADADPADLLSAAKGRSKMNMATARAIVKNAKGLLG